MRIPNKTLIIRFSSIGDIVLSSPLIRILKKKFSSSNIDFAVRKEYADLVRFNPNLNAVYEFDTVGGFRGLFRLAKRLKSENYDLVIDIHNSLRSKFIRYFIRAKKSVVINKRIFARTMLVKFKKNYYREIVSVSDKYLETVKKLDIQNDSKDLEIFIPDTVKLNISEKLSALKNQNNLKIIGFCPSAKHITKRWPEERFIDAGARIVAELNAKIVIFGGENDKMLCSKIAAGINNKTGGEAAIDYSGRFSLLENAAAMDSCHLILTNDSGLMHIASARGKKITAIFGPTVREFGFFPVGKDNVILERIGLYCRPCSHIGLDICPEGHFRCMREISVEDAINALKSLERGTNSHI